MYCGSVKLEGVNTFDIILISNVRRDSVCVFTSDMISYKEDLELKEILQYASYVSRNFALNSCYELKLTGINRLCMYDIEKHSNYT